jgi:hypothetical protein
VETKSGLTGCSIAAELVACQTSAGNWPSRPDGRRFHIASVSADGEFHWVDADLGALEGRVALEYLAMTALLGPTVTELVGPTPVALKIE